MPPTHSRASPRLAMLKGPHRGRRKRSLGALAGKANKKELALKKSQRVQRRTEVEKKEEKNAVANWGGVF